VELIPWDNVRLELFGESERARLVDGLIATLDADREAEQAWAAEVERRQSEIENGTVSLLPGPESLAKLKAEFELTTTPEAKGCQQASRYSSK
jgi:Putative addiction module component.